MLVTDKIACTPNVVVLRSHKKYYVTN